MDQDILYKKIIEQSNKNRKTLINIHSQISAKKKNAQQQETVKYQNYMKEYDELVKFNKESE